MSVNNEVIEVDNNTDEVILVSVCRSEFSGKLYVHIGRRHGNEVEIGSHDYQNIDVNVVKY